MSYVILVGGFANSERCLAKGGCGRPARDAVAQSMGLIFINSTTVITDLNLTEGSCI